ncbi:MAG: tRNA pseudouridine(38-40) synthase TruA [Acidobacteriota bacterium]|nr:tRNA pseudouridine(38-40) synthase TruA [Acidobacteriota bacterium]
MRLDLAYDGTDFAGWQAQPDRDTVQGRIEAAVGRLYRRPPGQRTPVVGAGRTDAGVHAEGQVAHFDAPARIPPAGIRAGLNALLPDAIRVLAAAEAGPDFHARFSAAGKTYRYHLLTETMASPLRSRYAWPVGDGLSREAMEEGAAALTGRHDFRAFFTAPPGEEPETPVRNVFTARLDAAGSELVFEVTAEGFLRYMVRRMVGTLVAIGRGQLPPERVAEMLRDPEASGPRFRAPAAGLRLYRVHYRHGSGKNPAPSVPDGGEPGTAKLAGPCPGAP